MWRLKQFMPKDQAGLEGKSVEVGALKLQIRSLIAQGGFSSVYLARDAQSGKNYALKHIICNDAESLDLVRKEVAVMKSLRGHPNVVMLHAQAILDTGAGRTKDCFLVMDYCERTLVTVLDSRGAGFFEEKQLLLIFQDICNAVYGMHSQSPPIAHRDLKAENLLMGPDGLWKLCDFGSTSTSHKVFERAEEMGLEEDIIRKHTTPAYRAPEMWDLYRRELISEKVDIWALGCLLYRMAYFKSAFDGESKLQILNGNYRIPEAPRYSSAVVDLIKDTLVASPEARPDITQLWRRVNEALPRECRKSPYRVSQSTSPEPVTSSRAPAPSRSPPPPPVQTQPAKSAGSFWSMDVAKEVKYDANNKSPPKSGAAATSWSARFPGEEESHSSQKSPQTPKVASEACPPKKAGVANFVRRVQQNVGPPRGKEENDGDGHATTPEKEQRSELNQSSGNLATGPSSDKAFNAFVAEFENKPRVSTTSQDEVNKLRQQLEQTMAEKAEYVGKFEKLTAICRSQRQEIQELKSALAAANANGGSKPPLVTSRRTNPVTWRSSSSSEPVNKEKQNGSIWELEEGMSSGKQQQQQQAPADSWQGFSSDSSRLQQQQQQQQAAAAATATATATASDVQRRRQQHARAASISGGDSSSWGFMQDSFANISQESSTGARVGSSSSFRAEPNARAVPHKQSQSPAGWAGF